MTTPFHVNYSIFKLLMWPFEFFLNLKDHAVIVKNITCLLACALLASCSNKLIYSDYEYKDDAISQTLPVTIISDTQIHENRGDPNFLFGKAGDEIIPVTIRTAQQTVGQNDLLLRALKLARANSLVLHLGDAIDVSCETEWRDFTSVMLEGRGPAGPGSWFFMPGNHDGYMVGNSALEEFSFWHDLCNAGNIFIDGKPRYKYFPKDQVVKRYLEALGQTSPSNGETSGCSIEGSYCWSAYIETGVNAYKSYIVQLIKLPSTPAAVSPIYALMLDSSNFSERPLNINRWAGRGGEFSFEQLQTARALVAKIPPEGRYFIAAHHPMKEWNFWNVWLAETKIEMEALWKNSKSLRFAITSHTHEGGWYKHKTVAGDVIELNTGSLIDWPIYYRDVTFLINQKGQFGVKTPLINMKNTSEICQRKMSCESQGCDIQKQAPASIRTKGNRFIAALHSITKYLKNKSMAKHMEMDPQLMVYRDVAEATLPADYNFKFEFNDEFLQSEEYDKATLLTKMTYMASECKNEKGLCSLSAKQNLLLSLHKYYWDEAPAEVRSKAHDIRFCAALRASEISNDLLATTKEGASKIIQISSRDLVLLPGGHLSPSK